MPREPSLRLGEDECFFERVLDADPAETDEKEDHFAEFLATAGGVSALNEKFQAASEHRRKAPKINRKRKKNEKIPMDIRKMEIELTQLRLPRRPSQKHLFEPTFYPLASCDLFEWPLEPEVKALPEMSEKKRVSFSTQPEEEKSVSTTEVGEYFDTDSDYYASAMELEVEEEDSSVHSNTSAAYIDEDEYVTEEDESYYDESYYSESEVLSEDEMSMEAENIFEEFLEMQRIHLQNVENVEIIEEPLQLNELPQVDDYEEEDDDDDYEEEIADDFCNRSLSTIADDESEEESDEEEEPPKKRKQSRTIGFVTTNLPQTRYESEDGTYLREVGFVPPLVRMMIFQARMEMRCRDVTEEHKKEIEPSLAEAILLARHTKLDEDVIETEGQNTVKHDDAVVPSVVWVKGKETVNLPNFTGPTPEQFLIFKEAVAMGGIKALKPEITLNYDPLASVTDTYEHEMVDVDDANKHKLIRTRYLTDMYLEELKAYESDHDDDEESLKYNSLDDVELPTNDCPEYQVQEAKLNEQELKDQIAQEVAERVWERRYRLERPRAQQRIKYRCTCKYCKTSSTYQTFAYRKKWLIRQNLWCGPIESDKSEEIIEVPDTHDSDEATDLERTSFRTKSTTDASIGRCDTTTVSFGEGVEVPELVSVSTTSEVEEFSLADKSFSSTFVPMQKMPEERKELKVYQRKSFAGSSRMASLRSIFGS